jgi:hypothetical protein
VEGESFLENKLNLRGLLPPVFDRVNFDDPGAAPSWLVASTFGSFDTVGLVDEIELAFVDSSSPRLLLWSSRLLGEGDRDMRGELHSERDLALPRALLDPGPEFDSSVPTRWYVVLPTFFKVFANVDSVIVGVLGLAPALSVTSRTASCPRPRPVSRDNGDIIGVSVGLGKTAVVVVVVVMSDLGCKLGEAVLNGGSGGRDSSFGCMRCLESLGGVVFRRRMDRAGANGCRKEKVVGDRAFS